MLLEIKNLTVAFNTRGECVEAVRGVSLAVPAGKTVALVGESGSGKSVTAMAVLRLIPQPPARVLAGEILFRDPSNGETVDLLRLDAREIRKVRGRRIAMVFQEPMTALNPVMKVGRQIGEVLELHRGMVGRQCREEVVRLLTRVGIGDAERRAGDYPHQFSGGMRQRVMIAMALAGDPALLIADEPTTALDVTIQRQILELLRDIQQERGMGILLITHDFSVVSAMADQVYVMQGGRVVEEGPVERVMKSPQAPYTRSLLESAERLTGRQYALLAEAKAAP